MEANKPLTSFVSTGLIPTGINKCSKKIVIGNMRDPELFRIKMNLFMICAPKDSESIH
jgi:hypothetical protein